MANHNAIPPAKGGSRKGIPNKITGDVKAMVLEALDKAGGSAYLLRQSEENPVAFMSLVGRVLPLTVSGDGQGIIVQIIKQGEPK